MHRPWQDLFDGKSRRFVCVGLRSHGEIVEKGRRGEDHTTSVCLWSTFKETYSHSVFSEMDVAGLSSMSQCTTSSASQGWPPGQDMEPVGERLGLENVESGGIFYWSMSCMGKVVESVAGYRRWLEVSSCKDSGSRQQVPVGQIGLDSAEGAKYGQPGDCRGERYDENSEKRMGESAMCWWAEGSEKVRGKM